MKRAYSDTFADHLRRPRNVGEIDVPDGVSVVRDHSCGDLLRLTLRIRDGRIEEAGGGGGDGGLPEATGQS